jgi:hypothetical protein
MTDFASRVLPKHRIGLRWLSDCKWWQLAACGVGIYVLIVFFSFAVEAISFRHGSPMVVDSQGKPAGFRDLLYFNFITILTIGYGDFIPIHWGRFISVCEALSGAGMFGLLISVVVAKMMAAPANAVVFSKLGYYCTDEQRFLIVFVNTTHSILVNVDISSYFKLGGNWTVSRPKRTPFIGRTVWTFFMNRLSEDKLVAEFKDGDVFRCGLTGQVGGASFSVAIEYSADEILVIPNRKELTAFKGFWEADLASEEVARMFHYRPDGALTLAAFVAARRYEGQTTS